MPTLLRRPDRFWNLLALLLSLSILAGCSVPALEEGTAVPPKATVTPGATRPTRIPVTPAASPDDQTWLVMLYQDADDEMLEEDILTDLNEAELVGSSDRVHIVAQIDRYDGGFDGDGDWTSTKRFYITQDDDLETLASEEIADIGEVNMADGDTLVDFVRWAVTSYPADKYVLILSDHGAGWPGGWSDPEPGGLGDHQIALAESFGDMLFLMELDEALQRSVAETGIGEFELIGFDACLMSHLEVFSAIAPYARYAVASQEVEPSLGWAYAALFGRLVDSPEIDGAELARAIVDSYIDQDQRIIDDQARAKYLEQVYEYTGEASAEELIEEESKTITLTGVDLMALPSLIAALDRLVFAMTGIDQQAVASARTYAQTFQNTFDEFEPEPYIDLGHFAELLKEESSDAEVHAAADELLAALDQVVIAERHGPEKPGARGISIHFPNSTLFSRAESGYDSYTTVASSFAGESRWDDFLVFHYTGQPIAQDGGATPAPRPEEVSAPGAGEITIAPLQRSSLEVSEQEPLLMETEVTGDRVGFIYLFVGYLDEESNAIQVLDIDYLDAEETKQIGGVFYPDWGSSGTVTIEFEWEPILFAINDGQHSEIALLNPEDYGASPEDAIYAVDGIYTFAKSKQSRNARLLFRNGKLIQVLGFTGKDGMGALREITPKQGDRFTILEQWIDLGESEDDEVEMVWQEGATLVFGTENFVWEEVLAPEGDYVVGFIVEDLDGNIYEQYEVVTVR